jgi:hypothetical protein
MLNPTKETLALTKAALNSPMSPEEALAKGVTVSTGLVYYDLQAPAKNLYPVITPLRNKIPRVGRPIGYGDSAKWKQIAAITGSGYNSMGWVPEGQRSGTMSYSATQKAAAYCTLGEEDYATYEAISAGEGFENVESTDSLRTLQKMMLKEESALLGGNGGGVQLGTPSQPSLSAGGSGATLPALTYSVIVVALTYEGWKNASLSSGVATTKTITGADGGTFVLNGGSSNKSTNNTQAITLGPCSQRCGRRQHVDRVHPSISGAHRGARPYPRLKFQDPLDYEGPHWKKAEVQRPGQILGEICELSRSLMRGHFHCRYGWRHSPVLALISIIHW